MRICIFIFLLIFSVKSAVCEGVKFDFSIGDHIKVKAVGNIMADPPITVTINQNLIKNHEGKNYFKCEVHFSRAPLKSELDALRLAVLPEESVDPIGMGTVYSEKVWKDLQGDLWKIGLIYGKISIPFKYRPSERIMYVIKSADGYYSTSEASADKEGKCDFQWEGGTGRSLIKVITSSDYTKAMDLQTHPVWKTWQFLPSPDGKSGELSPVDRK
jgi:hypothetical protein